MKEIINMTPHPINLVDEDGTIYKTFPKGERVIRLASFTELVEVVDGVRFTKTVFGEAEGLPFYSRNILYIVSQLVKSAFPNRTDLLVPSEIYRTPEGIIVGCKSLGL